MRDTRIDEGAIWYWEVRRREKVFIDEELRATTIHAIEDAHQILSSAKTPPPTDKTKKCRACSLVDLCEPETFRRDHSSSYIQKLYDIES